MNGRFEEICPYYFIHLILIKIVLGKIVGGFLGLCCVRAVNDYIIKRN